MKGRNLIVVIHLVVMKMISNKRILIQMNQCNNKEDQLEQEDGYIIALHLVEEVKIHLEWLKTRIRIIIRIRTQMKMMEEMESQKDWWVHSHESDAHGRDLFYFLFLICSEFSCFILLEQRWYAVDAYAVSNRRCHHMLHFQ